MSQLIYIPFDHLHRNFGALREANVKEDVIAWWKVRA
jgi:deoxyribodipyrimidine photolyase-related protein